MTPWRGQNVKNLTVIIIGLFVSLLFNINNSAAASTNLDFFHKFVEIKRDAKGKLIELDLKPMGSQANAVKTSSTMMAYFNSAVSNRSLSPMTTLEAQRLASEGWTAADIKNFNDAKKKLSSSDVQAFLGSTEIDKIMAEFEKDINFIFAFNVLSKPGVPGYFHDRKLIDMAINKAISLAEGALGNTPALKVVEFLISETLGMVADKRSYCQFALLYYLEKTPAADLGLTDTEVAYIKSSMYEAQISWYDFPALHKAEKNWSTYGSVLFTNQAAQDARRLAKYGPSYGQVLPNYNYSFTPIQSGSVGYVFNTFNKKSELSGDLSLAYDSSAPKHIRDLRIELELARLGASFLPLPSFVIGQLTKLLASYYTGQKVTEGALYAYLSANGQDQQAKTVLNQAINPFLTESFK
jgi:hypothetical protein